MAEDAVFRTGSQNSLEVVVSQGTMISPVLINIRLKVYINYLNNQIFFKMDLGFCKNS